MSKNISVILFLLIAFTTKAQWEHPDLKMGFQWKYFEDSTITTSDMRKMVENISKNEAWKKLESDELEEFLQGCHFTDFNGDSIVDIIYTGRYPADLPVNNVAFLKNTGIELKLVMNLHGDLRLLNKLHGKLMGKRFTIQRNALEGEIINTMTSYYFEKNGEYANQIPFRADESPGYLREFGSDEAAAKILEFIYVRNLHFPEEAGTKNLRTFHDTTYLMQKPRPLDNTDFSQPAKYFLTQSPFENKAIGQVLPASNLVAIGYEVLDNIPYFLVMVDNNELLDNYLSGHSGFQLGWISGKHVITDSSHER